MRKISVSLLACLSFATTALAGVPNDFDGDGSSDRTWVEIESDKTLTWSAELSTTRAHVALGSLGKSGDAIIMAQWLTGGTQIGVASVNTETNQIEWTIRDAAGAVYTKSFGQKGDLVVSGADFDGNGLGDAAVVRLEGKKARWVIKLDFFASETPVEKTLIFGVSGDRAFYARAADGSAVDWIGITRKGKKSKTLARVKDINSGVVQQFARLPKFASAGARPRPFPVRQSSGADLIGFSVGSAGKTSVKIFSLPGAAVFSTVFSGTGTSVVGEFLQGAGYEVLYESKEDAYIVNPGSIDITDTLPLGGIPVDEININTLGAVTATPTPTGGGDSNPGEVAQCGRTAKAPGSFVYKTIGSSHFNDIRRNTIGLVIRSGGAGPFPPCIEAIDTAGNVIAKLGLYATGNGWAARYYAGIRCGASTPYNGAAVAERARSNTGASNIYLKFDSVCYGPIDASRCIGSSQC